MKIALSDVSFSQRIQIGNEIEPEGVAKLCEAMKVNTTLRSLDISGELKWKSSHKDY